MSSTLTCIQHCISGCGKLGCVGTDVEEKCLLICFKVQFASPCPHTA